MIKTIDITNITDEMVEVAAASAQLRAMAGVTENTALISGSILAALIMAPEVEPDLAAIKCKEPAQSVAEPAFCGQIPVDQCRALELAAWEGDDGNVYSHEEVKSLGDSEDAAIALFPLYRAVIKPKPPIVPPAIVEQIKTLRKHAEWNHTFRAGYNRAIDDVLKILEAGNE